MRRTCLIAMMLGVSYAGLAGAAPAGLPPAIYVDPPHDAVAPARMEVLHIPSHGVRINGVVYLAAGKGPHPTLVLLHGLPGNEKNLDLAQAVRRAGWNVVTFNYRGSWGSPGSFGFANARDDADAVLDYLHTPEQIEALGIDPARIVLGGHTMGGWITAMVASHRHDLAGAILISAADMPMVVNMPPAKAIAFMADNMETLNGVSPEGMVEELHANAKSFALIDTAQGLAGLPLLILSSDDGLAPATDALIRATRAAGNLHVADAHANTDHGWSDMRIALESNVIMWLERLR